MAETVRRRRSRRPQTRRRQTQSDRGRAGFVCPGEGAVDGHGVTQAVLPIFVPIAPKRSWDLQHLRSALDAIAAETDKIRYEAATERNEIILHGQSEFDLELAVYRLQQEHHIELTIGAPNVAYLEAFRNSFTCEHTHKSLENGGEFAQVKLKFEPTGTLFDPVVVNSVADGALPEEFFAGVRRGIERACRHGPTVEAQVVGVHALLVDATRHPTDSSADAFERAAEACWKKAIPYLRMIILEPIMAISVRCPEEHLGDVIGDLNSRRCAVLNFEGEEGWCSIRAEGPFANLFGYMNSLMQMTKGRASFKLRFERYAPVPLMGPPDSGFPGAIGLRP
jgi:elongation factor G